jgi:hypothetical protein
MNSKSKMSERELASFIHRKIEQSLNDEDGDVSNIRQDNFDYYMGKPYGTEREGSSSIVTREALETIEWAMPSIMRVFTSGDRVVTFDAVGPEDEPLAEQETDVTNHLMMKAQNGFMAFYCWFKDALMYPNGYVKTWVEEVEETRTEEYHQLTIDELQALVEDENCELEEALAEVIDTPTGPMEVYSVACRITETKPKLVLEPVPPEQVLIDNDLTGLDVDGADFVCHRVQRTYTWLVNNGYDADKLDLIGTVEDHEWNDERVNRMFHEDENPDGAEEDDESMRKFWVNECYMQVDFDGDGLAERRKVVCIGTHIFENEEMDYQPITALGAIPIPHKHIALSLIDIVKDLQLIRSTLTRQLLDNIYKINVPKKYVGENFLVDGGMTLEAMMNAAAEIVPAKDPMAVNYEIVQPMAQHILPVIQQIDEQKNTRTGISPNISLSPETLQQSTMGAFMGALEQAAQRVELITRIFAETGVKQLTHKVHQMIRQHMGKELALKLKGQWVQVNPASWRDRTDLTVNVGLGFGNKEKDMALTMGLLEVQERAAQGGLATPQNIYNGLARLVEVAGLKDVDRYFTNPANNPQQEQPDPMAMMAQAQLQLLQQEQARKDQEAMHKAQLETFTTQYKAALEKKDQQIKAAELQLKAASEQTKAQNVEADTRLKQAQTMKVSEEAKAQDIENDLVESGVSDLLGGANG